MIILIHSICIAFSGLGNLNNVDNAISVSAAMLLKQTQLLENLQHMDIALAVLGKNWDGTPLFDARRFDVAAL